MENILKSLSKTIHISIVLSLLLFLGLFFGNDGFDLDLIFWSWFFRYLHVLSGVMWIGLLWYFNFVQIRFMSLKKASLIILVILLIDQISKIYIKTHFSLNDDPVKVFSWFEIAFVENDGMAWGAKLSDFFTTCFSRGKKFTTKIEIHSTKKHWLLRPT